MNASSNASSKTAMTGSKIVRKWIREIFRLERGNIGKLVGWSLLLSVVNAALLAIIGPVFKAFFTSSGQSDQINLKEFFSVWSKIIPLPDVAVSQETLILTITGVLCGVALSKMIVLYMFLVSQEGFALSFTHRYRTKLFGDILKLPFLEISKHSESEWMSCLVNDISYLQTRISEMLKVCIKESTMIIGALMILLLQDPLMTFLLLATFSPLLYFGYKLSLRISVYIKSGQEALAKLSGIMSHLRKTFWFFRSQGGESIELSGFKRFNTHYTQALKKTIFVRSILTPSLEFFGAVALCGVLIYFQYVSATPQPEYTFQVILSMGIMMRPLRALGDQFSKFSELKGALKKSFDVIESSHHKDTGNSLKSPQKPTFHPLYPVSIKNIEFTYKDSPFLKCRDVHISSGEHIAIVGASGSGKSSFLKILAGIIPPSVFQANLNLAALTSQTSYVGQSPFFFNGSLEENLYYQYEHKNQSTDSTTNSTRDELLMTTMQALSLDYDNLKDSPIETGQMGISTGQLQRLAIARSILREKPLLLFDEASSALDETNEKAALSYLRQLTKDHSFSSIWITHRFEMLGCFDKVWLMENGTLSQIPKESYGKLKSLIGKTSQTTDQRMEES